MVEARPVRTEKELQEILELQKRNLPRSLDDRERAENGFVTVEHTLDVLQKMHALVPSIVAKDGDQLAGYALVMPIECRAFIPVLAPMFERLDANAEVKGRRYYVMGQICVAKAYRGQGVFDRLYAAHREHLRHRFDACVTEISVRNPRSLRAHARVGFEELERYRDAADEWVVVIWDLRT
ncbi:MAG: GNAT family N-acetyltransferase [Deltaproteobacteria bacterium]|nr:MAG: GNAT family N-acetyltransferase [Deltaproteobacteria bacterium]TMB35856.1 MAG: GNAT family N-acetyltransferase [Deltaproteobacteria bacterium]